MENSKNNNQENNYEELLPIELKNQALISPSGEHGWKIDYVTEAIREYSENNLAITGIETWAIVFDESSDNENIEDSIFKEIKQAYIGVIPCADGEDGVFIWSCEKKKTENWKEFVIRSSNESLMYVNAMNTEIVVIPELASHIYYNILFMDKEEYDEYGIVSKIKKY